MCLIAIATRVHPRYPLIVLANRDEFYARPSLPAARWKDDPETVGGRDLEKGGTWLAVSRGRVAAVTNVRDPNARRDGASRGVLVREVLATGAISAPATYPAFNVLLADLSGVRYARDDAPAWETLPAGIHVVSNARMNTPWPKTERLRAGLAGLLTHDAFDVEAAFALLADRTTPPEADWPRTGVPHEVEGALASAFVVMPGYGTRASTLVLLEPSGEATLFERSFGEGGAERGQVGPLSVAARPPIALA
jgi:uncharacterized protein with NRDE domain